MKPIRESVLLKTSSNVDVQNSGGVINITGLKSISKKNVASIKQIKYRTETVQVYTIGSSYSVTANTLYSIEIYDPNRRQSGYQESTKVYSYKTPPVLTTIGDTTADQREHINGKIIAKINSATKSNHATAVTLGSGTGFTITDNGGYYPVRSQSMTNVLGANIVAVRTNSDGTGFSISDLTLTTSAVTSFGVGDLLRQEAPVTDLMFGNLISGVLEAPPVATDGSPAVSGQNYDGFEIISIEKVDTPTITGHYTYIDRSSVVYVDNGTGSSTTNLSGFQSFERAMLQNIFHLYSQDTPTIFYMGNTNVTCGGTVTGAPSGTAQAENVINLGNGFSAHYAPIGTATNLALIATNSGIAEILDATASEGVEVSAPTWANSQKSFIVGKTPFSLYAKVSIDDVSGLNPMWFGFRKKAAYAAATSSYTDFAFIGLGSGAGDIYTSTRLNSGSAVSTDTTQNWADGETHILEVRVDGTGAVTFFLDGYKPTVTQAFTFHSGDEVIGVFGYSLQTSDIGTPSVLEFAQIADNTWRS